ncbi:hypothetical protein ACI1UN_00020 [Lactococcus petauri]|uniref:hypothetical protein n=1 Tax=Lactococcus petauri TaxID=1940789 RepID=UPI0038536330
MKDVPWLVLIIYIGNCFLIILFSYYVESYKYETTVSTLNEAVKASGINSYDYSMRINEGEVLLSTKNFEYKVETLFTKNLGFNIVEDTLEMKFDYLRDENARKNKETDNAISAIKAVRVNVSYNKNAQYELTYVTNVLE